MDNKKIKILLIEDNPGDVRLIKEMLNDAESIRTALPTFELMHVDRLLTGLKCLTEQLIDVIILDLSLPETQGLDTLNRVCVHTTGVPVVILTGYNDEKLAIKAVQVGAQDYLVKEQVDSSLLVRSIVYAIERHRVFTQLKRTEEELQQHLNELSRTQKALREKDKLAIIGQMAAGMAHEIRNPLTAVKGLAQLLKDKYFDNEILVGHMKIIIEEVNQANTVLTDFLQLARPKQPVLKRQSVSSLLEETLAIVNPQAFLKNIKVEYEGIKDLPYLSLDRGQIKQVLLNICQNAMEAMPEGGIIKISSVYLPVDNEIYIDIQDTGCGIPTDKLKSIGVPFYTTKAGGTGLGLSISYMIIDAHKGRVEVDSKDEGTRFRIYLPC